MAQIDHLIQPPAKKTISHHERVALVV